VHQSMDARAMHESGVGRVVRRGADAYLAVYTATQRAVTLAGRVGIFAGRNPVIVNVGGLTVTVYGRVIDGVARIGTFYLPAP
jgi:hypothetical protein